MADDNELKPLDISGAKSATSRIDLSKATVPRSPATGSIRIGSNPKKATSRIDINAIPGAAKAQTSRVGLGAMPAQDDDVYKRRTTLLDTSKIPLEGGKPAGTAQPRTIRIGGRPTVRVASKSPTTTFTPGRSAEAAAAPKEAGSGRPTIRLKRPGGAVSVTAGGGEEGGGSTLAPEPIFSIQEEEGPGAAWTVVSLLSLLVLIGVVVVQVMTNNAAAY